MRPDLNQDPKAPALPPRDPSDPTQIIPHGPPPPARQPNGERPEEAPTQPQIPQQPTTPRQVASPMQRPASRRRPVSGHLAIPVRPESDLLTIGRSQMRSDPLIIIDFPRGHTPGRAHGSARAVGR
jgi:hypothetical protein